MSRWHPRYHSRGVMIYWHVETNSICIYSQLKSCSSSEVSSMIEGVLRHCTDMDVKKNYVDTHGASEVGFAFSYVLNFDLLPRFKNIYNQKLYCVEKDDPTKYGNLTSIISKAIDWNKIETQYEQIIKYTAALKLGTADAETIMKRFTRNNIQHPTYKALSKTGAMRSNRPEELELSMLCLHLLQNCMVYINTLMLQQVLKESGWVDKLTIEDKRAITPILYEHINPYGLFTLDLSTRLNISFPESVEAA